MSAKEKEFIEQLAAMPEALQDKFLAQMQGAALAMDVLASAASSSPAPQETQAQPRA